MSNNLDRDQTRRIVKGYQKTTLLGKELIIKRILHGSGIAPDKAAYCVFTQFRGPENAIRLISVRTKTQ